MQGFLKVETVHEDGKEGVTCEVNLAEVSLGDKLQIMHAVAHGLHMPVWEVSLFEDMYKKDLFGKAETVYDRSSVSSQDNLIAQILGVVFGHGGGF